MQFVKIKQITRKKPSVLKSIFFRVSEELVFLDLTFFWNMKRRTNGSHSAVQDASFDNQTIWACFDYQTIWASFDYQTIWASFNYQTIWACFDYQTIRASFENQTIWASFDYQTIWAYFDYQTIWAYFDNQTIWASFDNQTIWACFEKYKIRPSLLISFFLKSLISKWVQFFSLINTLLIIFYKIIFWHFRWNSLTHIWSIS